MIFLTVYKQRYDHYCAWLSADSMAELSMFVDQIGFFYSGRDQFIIQKIRPKADMPNRYHMSVRDARIWQDCVMHGAVILTDRQFIRRLYAAQEHATRNYVSIIVAEIRDMKARQDEATVSN